MLNLRNEAAYAMKEITFLKRNVEKWKEIEQFLKRTSQKNPDKLADLFIELTDDLSYARTFYPNSETANYLNDLAVQVHQEIYRNKKEGTRRILSFWTREVPLIYGKHWKELLFTFGLLIVGFLIAVLSQHYDPQFADLILSPGYVDETLSNIEKGDPMGIYKGGNPFWSFTGITINNIRVALLAFAWGLLLSVGSIYIVFSNAIMVGSFYYIFYTNGAADEWWSFVWLHGTLEIWAIVVGAAAGIVLGNSLLFPGSYSRFESLLIGAKEGLKMVVGVVPLFIVAGFIEGFITRLTDMPHWINLLIILTSLAFIIWYFVIYPGIVKRRELDVT